MSSQPDPVPICDQDLAIFQTIEQILQPFNPDRKSLRPETELINELNIDSVAAMDIIMEIEDRFDIDIPVNEISGLRRVQDLIAMVKQQQKGG